MISLQSLSVTGTSHMDSWVDIGMPLGYKELVSLGVEPWVRLEHVACQDEEED